MQGFERLQFDVIGILADRFVDLGDLIGPGVGEQAALFGFGGGGVLFGYGQGDLLLLLGLVAL